jgi:pSer/pThr/pTyr-binding forkhead associated (FHA) protein
MTAPPITLTGTNGVFAGIGVDLGVGERLVVGRSRFVDLSAVRTPIATRIGRDKLEKNEGFRRMSRRHFEVFYESPERVVIVDLSRNGVVLDGRRILRSAVLDPAVLSDEGVRIRFGSGEELRLAVRKAAGVPG